MRSGLTVIMRLPTLVRFFDPIFDCADFSTFLLENIIFDVSESREIIFVALSFSVSPVDVSDHFFPGMLRMEKGRG
jgi:hypothetical protein